MAQNPCAMAIGRKGPRDRLLTPLRVRGSAPLATPEHPSYHSDRAFALPPQRRPQRTTGKNASISRDMAQDDPLSLPREQHIMFTHDVAAANGAEADGAFARARDPITAGNTAPPPTTRRALRLRPAPTSGRCPRAHQPSCDGAPRSLRHPNRHPAPAPPCGSGRPAGLCQGPCFRPEPPRHAGRRRLFWRDGLPQARRADHMHRPRLSCQSGKFGRGSGRGKVDHGLRPGKSL